MTVFWACLLFIAAIFLTIKSADFFIEASKWLSDVSGISKAVIGATVIGFATSAPEVFVSIFASIKGYNDMASANIIGSLICNIGAGLAIVTIARPGKNQDNLLLTCGLLLILSTSLLFVFCLKGYISIFNGIILFTILVFFTIVNIRHKKNEKTQKRATNKKEVAINCFLFVFGITGVLVGANVLVDNAKIIALALGVSEMVIGLTIVALGTSMPEMVTTIIAISKKESDMGIGNIIGSNVLDIAIFAPITLISGKIAVSKSTMLIDMPVALIFTLVAILPTILMKKTYRWQGITLALLYTSYITFLIIKSAI